MQSNWSAAVLVGLVVLTAIVSVAVTPAAASTPPDECANPDRGSGAGGPTGFVAGIVPDFLGDLFAGLPVPNFVKALVGAPTC